MFKEIKNKGEFEIEYTIDEETQESKSGFYFEGDFLELDNFVKTKNNPWCSYSDELANNFDGIYSLTAWSCYLIKLNKSCGGVELFYAYN